MRPSTDGTALLVIDPQNAFFDPEGMCARLAGGLEPSLEAAIEPIGRCLEAARAAGVPVIYTKHAWTDGYTDGGFIAAELLPIMNADAEPEDAYALTVGSWEAEILPSLAPQPGDHVVDKNRFDAFIGTGLDQLLRRLGVSTLVVTGVVTTVCVESTVRDAAMHDYRTFLVADAVGDQDQAMHEHGVERMGRIFAHLVTADDCAAAWTAAPVGAAA